MEADAFGKWITYKIHFYLQSLYFYSILTNHLNCEFQCPLCDIDLFCGCLTGVCCSHSWGWSHPHRASTCWLTPWMKAVMWWKGSRRRLASLGLWQSSWLVITSSFPHGSCFSALPGSRAELSLKCLLVSVVFSRTGPRGVFVGSKVLGQRSECYISLLSLSPPPYHKIIFKIRCGVL